MNKPNHLKVHIGMIMLGVMLLVTSCGGTTTLLGYAVAHSDLGVLVVEALTHEEEAAEEAAEKAYRDAVWVSNLHRNQVGNLLKVELRAVSDDSYPALSSSMKTRQMQQFKGERSILVASLNYAMSQWVDALPSVDSVKFDKVRSEWEITIGNIFDESQKLRLLVTKDKEITELPLEAEAK